MHYSNYSVDDLVADEFFQQWVFHPDEENDPLWQRWLANHPEKKAEVEQARQFLLKIKQKDTLVFQERQIGRIWERIESSRASVNPIPAPVHQGKRFFATRPWQVAAVLAGLLITFATYLLLNYSQRASYATAFGETQSITLPDGTQVSLNANSELSFSNDWSTEKQREVWLKGEAFFSVTKKPGPVNARSGYAKFIVHTHDLAVEVLGTKFNLLARQGKTQVVLQEGKVQVTDLRTGIQEKLMMKPGELVEVLQQAPPVTKKAVKTALYSAWKDNQLVFDDTPLRDIAVILEDNYGYQVMFEDPSLPDQQYTGVHSADSLSQLFEALSISFTLTITQRDNQLIFTPKRSK